MINEIKEKISKFFAEKDIDLEVVEKTETVESKFEETVLVDETTRVNIEPSLDNPELISIESEGEFLPVPPMTELELQDGRIIVTGEEAGIVVEVREAIAEEEVVEEDEAMSAPESTVEDEKKAKRVIESVVKESVFNAEEELETIKNQVKELETLVVDTFKYAEFAVKENEELKIKIEEFTKETESKIESFGKQESKEPVKTSKPLFGTDKDYHFNKNKRK